MQGTSTEERPTTVISAPGKVLLAGGYLVLDPHYSGIVVSTSSRFYTVIREHPEGLPFQISVRSPQFLEATWSYDILYFHRGAAVAIRPSVNNMSKNKFVHLAVERVLFLAMELLGHQTLRQLTAQGLEVIIAGDNDFYSQRGQLAALNLPSAFASLSQIPRFASTNCSLADVHKTGLGSSAALITSFICALMVHLTMITPEALMDEKSDGRAFVHNTAQYVHCLAQGKVGSGFDVSSATFGSQIYRRFDPQVIQPLMNDNVPAKLLPFLVAANAGWNHSVSPFRLPPFTRLLLADVDAGTDTPAAVGKVLSWKKTNVTKAQELWTALSALNEGVGTTLHTLSALHQKSPGAYKAAAVRLCGFAPDKWSTIPERGDEIVKAFVDAYRVTEGVRAKMREMGDASQVPIEPPEQTRLLDNCITKAGVIATGVPGAGGYDAIWVLVLDPPNAPNPSPVSLVEAVWADWKEMSVSPLSCTESNDRGVRIEDPNVVTNWLREAKYVV